MISGKLVFEKNVYVFSHELLVVCCVEGEEFGFCVCVCFFYRAGKLWQEVVLLTTI